MSNPAAALKMMKSLGLLDVIAEMIRENKPFQAYMAGQMRDRKVQVLLDLMDLGVGGFKTPLTFLSPAQLERLRTVTVGMPSGQAETFLAVLTQPPIDTMAFITELGLEGKDRSLPQQAAREALLADPDLASNPAGLQSATSRRLQIGRMAASVVASLKNASWKEINEDDEHYFVWQTPEGNYVFNFFTDWDGNEKATGGLVWTGGEFGEATIADDISLDEAKRRSQTHYREVQEEKSNRREVVQEQKSLRRQLLDFADDFRSTSGDPKARYQILINQAQELGLIDDKLRKKLNKHNRGVGSLKGDGVSSNELMAQGLEMIVSESKHEMLRTAGTNAKIVAHPHNFHPVVVEEAKLEREESPFEGFIDFQGLLIDVENKKGSVRTGTDPDGHPWSTEMFSHYGEIRGTEGSDGDLLDAYVGDNHDSGIVVVIHQHNPWDGQYDEDKVMLGYDSIEEAIGAYKKQYDKPGYFKADQFTVLPMGQFWRWVKDERNLGKRVKAAALAAAKAPPVNPNRGVWSGYEFSCPQGTLTMEEGIKGDADALLCPDGTVSILDRYGLVSSRGHQVQAAAPRVPRKTPLELMKGAFIQRFISRDAIQGRRNDTLSKDAMEEVAWEVGYEHEDYGEWLGEFEPLAKSLGADLRGEYDRGAVESKTASGRLERILAKTAGIPGFHGTHTPGLKNLIPGGEIPAMVQQKKNDFFSKALTKAFKPWSLDFLGVWVTSSRDHATMYGKTVYEVEIPEGKYREGRLPFQETFFSYDLAREFLSNKVQKWLDSGWADKAPRGSDPQVPRIFERYLKGIVGLNIPRMLDQVSVVDAAFIQLAMKEVEEIYVHSKAYLLAWKEQQKAAGYDGVVWKNSKLDVGSEGATHDAYLIWSHLPVKSEETLGDDEAAVMRQRIRNVLALHQEASTDPNRMVRLMEKRVIAAAMRRREAER